MLTPAMNPSKMGKKFAAAKGSEVGCTPTTLLMSEILKKKLKKLEKIIIYLNNYFFGR